MVVLSLSVLIAGPLAAQVQTEVPPLVSGAKPVTVEHVKVHGASLEDNLEGEAADREVIVYLPPSYFKDQRRRYPVVYALHGYSIGAEQRSQEIHVPQTIEGAFALGAKEMILVLPDSKTVYGGSMYSSSVTTGNFEKFIAHDVVSFVDMHYRTLPERLSRGLIGHSMGGYGATRIGMKYPEVFGTLYIMSPCCLSPRPAASRRVPPRPPAPLSTRALGRPTRHSKTLLRPLSRRPMRQTCRFSPARSWPLQRRGRRTRKIRPCISIYR